MNAETERQKQAVCDAFSDSYDFICRPVSSATGEGYLLYLDGMNDTERLEKNILTPLLSMVCWDGTEQSLLRSLPFAGNIKSGFSIREIAAGDTLLLFSGLSFIISNRKSDHRSVAEPPTSSVVKGPREGFVEDLKTNTVLLRRRLRTEKLTLEPLKAGTVSQTNIVLAYINDIAPKRIVEEVKTRLSQIEIDGIIDSSYIAKILEQNAYSLLKQIGNSEKADVVASKLLDGRVAVLVDGSPIVLTVPFLLIEDFEDSQDRYKMAARVTFLRLIRIAAVFMALILPATFVALQSHQYQILPLQLMISVINSTSGIPFSPTLEMLIALMFFEILTEASIRMPRHVGMALSVVGAIVLGQTAVEAGFLSSITVMVVALSGIGIYAVPDQAGFLGMMRTVLVISAGLLGIFGMLSVCLALLAYMLGLKNFGVDYLSPYAPDEGKLADKIVKRDLTSHYLRSGDVTNKIRMKNRRQRY